MKQFGGLVSFTLRVLMALMIVTVVAVVRPFDLKFLNECAAGVAGTSNRRR